MARPSDASDLPKSKTPNTTDPASYIEEWREDARHDGDGTEEIRDAINKMPGGKSQGADIGLSVGAPSPDARQGTSIKDSKVHDISTDPSDAMDLDLRPSLARGGPGRTVADIDA